MPQRKGGRKRSRRISRTGETGVVDWSSPNSERYGALKPLTKTLKFLLNSIREKVNSVAAILL